MLNGPVMIALEGIHEEYGELVAVRALSLRMPRGEVFGFLGPNGAGKTTTIRIMMGILVPSAGRARIDGLGDAVDSGHRRGRRGAAVRLAGEPLAMPGARSRATWLLSVEISVIATAGFVLSQRLLRNGIVSAGVARAGAPAVWDRARRSGHGSGAS